MRCPYCEKTNCAGIGKCNCSHCREFNSSMLDLSDLSEVDDDSVIKFRYIDKYIGTLRFDEILKSEPNRVVAVVKADLGETLGSAEIIFGEGELFSHFNKHRDEISEDLDIKSYFMLAVDTIRNPDEIWSKTNLAKTEFRLYKVMDEVKFLLSGVKLTSGQKIYFTTMFPKNKASKKDEKDGYRRIK